MDKTCLLLQYHQTNAYHVANEQSLTDDEGSKLQEGVAHRFVACS